MQGQDETRPPYARFERVAVEDREETQKQGRYVAKDVDMIHITRPGGKDTFTDRVDEYLKKLSEAARAGRAPANWESHFSMLYERWKKGEEGAVEGTPIKGWGIISPAQQDMLIRAGVLSVEDLAQLPDNELSGIGTGALTYKQKAIAWLQAAQSTGKMTEELTTLRARIVAMEDIVKTQTELIKALQAKLPQPAAAKA